MRITCQREDCLKEEERERHLRKRDDTEALDEFKTMEMDNIELKDVSKD